MIASVVNPAAAGLFSRRRGPSGLVLTAGNLKIAALPLQIVRLLGAMMFTSKRTKFARQFSSRPRPCSLLAHRQPSHSQFSKARGMIRSRLKAGIPHG
jgi:hypothetical protein